MSTRAVPEPVSSLRAREFEQIYREHAPLVTRTAWEVLSTREDAEDVLHTVFLKLLRKGSPPEFHKNPKGYLYRAAVNASLDVVKCRRRHPTLHPLETERVEVGAPSTPRFDEDMHEQLLSAIGQLPEVSAEIVLLRYLQDKSTKEIMETLGISRGVVAIRLFRARAQLRKLLKVSKGGPHEKR
jgi:RNA polymerase sigma-70 factor, ECF subfamily